MQVGCDKHSLTHLTHLIILVLSFTSIKILTFHLDNDKPSLYQWATPSKGNKFCHVFLFHIIIHVSKEED